MDQNIIIPIFGMLTGIIIPIAVFVWLYKDAKGKRETVEFWGKNMQKGHQELLTVFRDI